MPTVELDITLPEGSGLAELTADHINTPIRILALHESDTKAHGILEVPLTDDDIQTVHRTLEALEWIVSCEVLYADEDIGVIQYVIREPAIYSAALESDNVPVFPVVVRDGHLFVRATTSHDRLSQFGDALDAIGASYEVLSIRRSPTLNDLLTDRQEQAVIEAVEYGYYDTPRGCTLAELGETLGVSKGAASGLLRRAEERIVKEFVTVLSNESVSISYMD